MTSILSNVTATAASRQLNITSAGMQQTIERLTTGKRIKFICILGSEQGVRTFAEVHPDVPVFAAAIDAKLNDHGYIVPGLGDAGDRLFGTL